MQTTATPPAKNAIPVGGLSNGSVVIRTADLVCGRQLKQPIYDSAGVLLLAKGSFITPRFKELLKRRELEEINVAVEDAQELTRPEPEALENCLEDFSEIPLVGELVNKLDAMICDGGLFVKNSGSALGNRMVLHGCRGYDQRKRADIELRHQASAKALDGMMKYAMNGGTGCASALMQITGVYLTAMTEDCDLLMSLAAATSADTELSQHCLQMAVLGMAIAAESGLDAENVQLVGMCGLVHDWGMMRVPEKVRLARHVLTRSEFVDIQKHPIHSLEFLEKISGIPGIIPLVCYQVHERPDGSGYPRGRSERQIHPFAKILNVVDTYIALTKSRPQREALIANAAIECLIGMSALGKVDSDVVQKLVVVLSMYPIGSLLELSDGSIAQTLRRNGLKYNQPIVRLIRTVDGSKAPSGDEEIIIDLSQSELKIRHAIPTPGRVEKELTSSVLEIERS